MSAERLDESLLLQAGGQSHLFHVATSALYTLDADTLQTVQALQRGDAAICKGSQWPDAPPHNLLHRSPPIAGTGLSRLLLVVDVAAPADAEEDEEWAAHLRPRRVK